MLKTSENIIQLNLPLGNYVKKTIKAIYLESDRPKVQADLKKILSSKNKHLLNEIEKYEQIVDINNILHEVVYIKPEIGKEILGRTILFNSETDSLFNHIFSCNKKESIKRTLQKYMQPNKDGLFASSLYKNLFIKYINKNKDIDFLIKDEKNFLYYIENYSEFHNTLSVEEIGKVLSHHVKSPQVLFDKKIYNKSFLSKIEKYYLNQGYYHKINFLPEDKLIIPIENINKEIKTGTFLNNNYYDILNILKETAILLEAKITSEEYIIEKKFYEVFQIIAQELIDKSQKKEDVKNFDYKQAVKNWKEKILLNESINKNVKTNEIFKI